MSDKKGSLEHACLWSSALLHLVSEQGNGITICSPDVGSLWLCVSHNSAKSEKMTKLGWMGEK